MLREMKMKMEVNMKLEREMGEDGNGEVDRE